ncbi:MAG TPA: universal stress protein [Myxococcota bacterium]|nr:universal stress protein [Myxococcota bacterium]
MFPLRRILVPMDDSALSDKALDTALTLAETYQAELWPLFVRAVPKGDEVPYMDEYDVASLEKALRGNVQERLRVGHGLPPDRIHPELRTGDPESCILEAAADHHVDLIVMGSHGRHGVMDRLFGSTTERILARGHFAMLVLRDPPEA